MQKTKEPIYLPLSPEALKWMPERGDKTTDDHVFDLPSPSMMNILIKPWAKAAGIDKRRSLKVVPCCIVRIRFDDTSVCRIHSFFSHLLSFHRISISYTDSKTQLQWVGKSDPLLYITFIYIVGCRNELFVRILIECGNSCIQLIEECIICYFLRIIRSSNFAIRTYLRIRYRTESISYTMHSCHLYHLCNGIRNRIIRILWYKFHLGQIRI